MRVAVYVRVSTADQSTENQLMDLQEVIRRNEWEVVETYNETVSGTKGVNEREQLSLLLKDARRKKFEKVIIWSVCRLGRSIQDVIGVIGELNDLGIDIFAYQQGIDTSTVMGKSFFHMSSIFAELENNLRAERQRIGIKRALENGAKFGRKPKINNKIRDEVVTLRGKGMSYRNIGKQLGLTATTVHKAFKQTQQSVI